MANAGADNREYHITDCVIGIENNTEANSSRFLISKKPEAYGGTEKIPYDIDKSNSIKRIFLDKV